jgi:hypothetical protein
LSENKISDLIIDQPTLREVDETICVEVRIAIIRERQVRHIQATAGGREGRREGRGGGRREGGRRERGRGGRREE